MCLIFFGVPIDFSNTKELAVVRKRLKTTKFNEESTKWRRSRGTNFGNSDETLGKIFFK